MDELLAKDLAFFQNNYAGSLTKRALGFARRFEDVFDVLAFQISRDVCRWCSPASCCGPYSPWLIVVLMAMLAVDVVMIVPLIRRRRASSTFAKPRRTWWPGTWPIRSPTPRPYAPSRASPRRPHPRQQRPRLRPKTLRSWDYQNTRVDLITSPMFVLTNTLGLIVALGVARRQRRDLEAVFITFSYFTTATRVMWEFNRIYRNLEGALTDAAQFAELLLDPPAVVDVPAPQAFAPARCGVEFRNVSFRYSAVAAAAVRALLADDRPGREARPGRTIRRRQDDADAAAAAVVGRRGWRDARRRAAHRSRPAGGAAAGDRVRAAGPGDVPPQHRRQHPGRTA